MLTAVAVKDMQPLHKVNKTYHKALNKTTVMAVRIIFVLFL